MKFHDAANIYPLDEANLDALADDIKEQGQQVEIEILDGEILDGRRRYLACQKAGVAPEFRAVKVADPIAHVVSLNRHRRHLTLTQLSMCAGRARNLYDEQAKERQQESGKVHGRGQEKVVENLPEPISAGRARDQAGKVFGVSGKTVDFASMVLDKGTPELIAAVDADLIAVSTASRTSHLPDAEQNALVQRVVEQKKNGHKPRKRPSIEEGGSDTKVRVTPTTLQTLRKLVSQIDKLCSKPALQVSIVEVKRVAQELKELVSKIGN